MCGIAGLFSRDDRAVDRAAITAMSAALVHRGPDGEGFWLDGPIGLAHRRLAIRDLSESGRQPMLDASERIVVTYNGELYNDQELRAELERDFGFRFRSTCDTEILPYAYLAWGEAMFERLEGFFAIGLWDRQAQRLILARDGIGIKPLYYFEDDNLVLFASEVKGIFASGKVDAQLDAAALHTFLAAGHPGTRQTIFKQVKQLPPGSVVSFTNKNRAERRFWRPVRAPTISGLERAVDLLQSTIETVVKSQMVSDVPLAVLQSGGIDSSLITLTLGRLGLKPPLFTAGFTEKSHDETDIARQIAASAGLSLSVIDGETGGDVEAALRSVVYYFDGQCADTGALGFYHLASAVRKHCTVVLSGDGGDEFFGGYDTYAATRIAEVARHFVPRGVAGMIGRFAYDAVGSNEKRLPAAAQLARFALGLSEPGNRPHLQWRRLVPTFLAEKIYGPEMSDLALADPFSEYAEYYSEPHEKLLDRALNADQRFHLQSVLAKVDAMSMAHSLEVRVPILDRRVMDLAGAMDISLLNPSPKGPPKYVLRKLAERLGMPRSAAWSRKRGFNVPIAQLMRRGGLQAICDRVLNKDADVFAPYLKPDPIRALWKDHFESRHDNAFALWPILTLGIWKAGLAAPNNV
ncbi:asparagine synthase (glutamine-hydrolyzing) [Bradyrhizobium canariense]|uniref:asparagine synthase (glutamine-hydrolyzing) n=1 Tax=Bradyrhizobium canariense TaxID=255045 RepID=A0A1H1PEY9_9BRAD|nr:asparagine synthase (glutamine-hydrolyzing) [Bradyrhizobium canariense]SDS09792.1 asparagine synthase (glutamine-hydrolysing) [Bradyrhizobium canariense]